MRVLGRVRLSRFDTGSTSVERQRELVEQWAAANDHTIVGWAEDIDLSGSVDPFDSSTCATELRVDVAQVYRVMLEHARSDPNGS